MNDPLVITVGIVVSREKATHHWSGWRWRTVGVVAEDHGNEVWREIGRQDGRLLFHAGRHQLRLCPRQVAGYRVNLANGEPSVYVVLDDVSRSASDQPILVEMVSASPFEVQALRDPAARIVDRVAMPAPLVMRLRSFIDRQMRTPASSGIWPVQPIEATGE